MNASHTRFRARERFWVGSGTSTLCRASLVGDSHASGNHGPVAGPSPVRRRETTAFERTAGRRAGRRRARGTPCQASRRQCTPSCGRAWPPAKHEETTGVHQSGAATGRVAVRTEPPHGPNCRHRSAGRREPTRSLLLPDSLFARPVPPPSNSMTPTSSSQRGSDGPACRLDPPVPRTPECSRDRAQQTAPADSLLVYVVPVVFQRCEFCIEFLVSATVTDLFLRFFRCRSLVAVATEHPVYRGEARDVSSDVLPFAEDVVVAVVRFSDVVSQLYQEDVSVSSQHY